ncbi:MAG: monofunctional biosynthetic peptidoglycan transglycosylase, partial [Prevotella sp.]
PRKFSSKSPGSYMRKRQRQILSNMRFIPSFPKEGSDYNPSTAAGGVYSK